MSADHYQVIIIGFGPTGAVIAGLLGREGISTLAIDRARDIYDKPRAIALDHEIMRLFDNLGIAGEVSRYVAPFPASEHFGAQGQLIRRIDMVGEPYPLGYTPSMVFTQPPVEQVMRDRVARCPSVTVELGTTLVDVRQDAQAATVVLTHEDGRAREVTADYVIACDGASSTVRQKLGIHFDDLDFDEPWLVVDLRVNDNGAGKLPKTAAQFCNPARPTTYIIGPGNHRRFEIMLRPGEDRHVMEQPEQVWQLLSPWLSPDDGELWRAASYRFHALVASRWRQGRVLLAGDAAHQQPPFIGQGMCQGLRDAANLSWKLIRVLRAESQDTLLDSYETERSTHVRELTTRIKAIGRVICEQEPVAAAARDARILAEGGGSPRTITRQEIVPPLTTGLLASKPSAANGTLFPQPWILRDGGRALLDTITGTGWRLVLDGTAPIDSATAPADITTIIVGGSGLHEESGVVARWFERHGCRAALVRPDHYVYGVAKDAPELAALLSELNDRLH
ncbi:putative FAD-binding monooxygenase; putative 3-(3-hydroxy-phenyl)propionate hydroxylase [Bradyrhizobium sp. ORS 285]|uniref:bifunctional 3-(3-hydroxy-phenyl)propionate/3-hydroxycinnamic acid hydroxylase n=1 Tax=Bradyrhizobium sp. ORS 285 TaxID=115808 RepID=UPI0002407DFF|nr:bifunctional 3-(3-hydroxy-phenyl)propionate/3-hydroxycinnamic acid hydroxylase [Bradyrhizobium sp. ORS 285]CCD84459.1 putative FAD-binding monooxygenase; putative 3-(3-hydroxy-phenyl)propionate hydroxylase [Bradyrhizobium sp. ORS 285]SMX57258.1 putative FAD-binding monooxygenase; putative 3-(3-hydroxy-phenyl)propionate hydroxylase [Bradyrhizobium sp. ORS 285]